MALWSKASSVMHKPLLRARGPMDAGSLAPAAISQVVRLGSFRRILGWQPRGAGSWRESLLSPATRLQPVGLQSLLSWRQMSWPGHQRRTAGGRGVRRASRTGILPLPSAPWLLSCLPWEAALPRSLCGLWAQQAAPDPAPSRNSWSWNGAACVLHGLAKPRRQARMPLLRQAWLSLVQRPARPQVAANCRGLGRRLRLLRHSVS